LPELKVGVAFPRIALETMRHRVGEVAARRLVVGAQTHLPAEAAALGIVDEVVDPAELRDRAVAAARALADEIPLDTFAATKSALRREALDRADRYGDADTEAIRLWSRRAEDGWVAAYLESVTRR
jgi:enoyl-CoA hydratase